MNDAPVVLGINRTQDASICLMHGSALAMPPYLVRKRIEPELPE
jgi:hypothetical protein